VRLRLLSTALAAVVALLAAGCGTPPEHALDKTRSCLQDAGARVAKPTGDFVATTATDGAIRAYLHGKHGTFVTLSFGADEDEAASTVLGYQRFHGRNIGLADILYTDKNVVMLWKEHPTDADAALVTGCLK
jgi:hypothetical protein